MIPNQVRDVEEKDRPDLGSVGAVAYGKEDFYLLLSWS